MKVKAYIITKSGKALLIPAEKSDEEVLLTPEAEQIKRDSDRQSEFDLNDPVIGVNQTAAITGIARDGFYVNSVEIHVEEHK